MIDPIRYWTRAWQGWATIATSAAQIAETAQASRTVMESRADTIGAAIAFPLQTDQAELTRMVAEKVLAFSLSGGVIARAWVDAQAKWWNHAQAAGKPVAAGRMPTAGDVWNAWSGGAMDALLALEAGARAGRDALAPVRSAVLANRRRLGARPGRKRAG